MMYSTNTERGRYISAIQYASKIKTRTRFNHPACLTLAEMFFFDFFLGLRLQSVQLAPAAVSLFLPVFPVDS